MYMCGRLAQLWITFKYDQKCSIKESILPAQSAGRQEKLGSMTLAAPCVWDSLAESCQVIVSQISCDGAWDLRLET